MEKLPGNLPAWGRRGTVVDVSRVAGFLWASPMWAGPTGHPTWPPSLPSGKAGVGDNRDPGMWVGIGPAGQAQRAPSMSQEVTTGGLSQSGRLWEGPNTPLSGSEVPSITGSWNRHLREQS